MPFAGWGETSLPIPHTGSDLTNRFGGHDSLNSHPHRNPDGSWTNTEGLNALQSHSSLPQFSAEQFEDVTHGGLRMKDATFVTVRMHNVVKAKASTVKGIFEVSQMFLESVLNCAEQFSGNVHQLLADSVVIGWNAFEPYPFHEVRACMCAMHIAAGLSELPIRTVWSIAVTYGNVVCGTVGNSRNRTMMVNGDAFFMGRMLTEVAKIVQSHIVVTENILPKIRTQVFYLPIDVIELGGSPTPLFELRGTIHEMFDPGPYIYAFTEFRWQRYDSAIQYWTETLRKHPAFRNDVH